MPSWVMYKMDMDLMERRQSINRRLKTSILLMILCWGLSLLLIYVDTNNIFLILEVMLMMFHFEEYEREFMLTSCRMLISVLPTIVHLVSFYKINDIMKESKNLHLEEIKYARKKRYEEERKGVQNFLNYAAKLSRSDQIELLNYIKDELRKIEKEYKTYTWSSDEYSLCYIQKELEDMLFPSIIEDEKSSAKCRKRNDNV